MKKQIILILILFLSFTSCEWIETPKPDISLITRFDLTKEYTIPVKEGSYSVVTRNPLVKSSGGFDTIAITNVSTTIDISKNDNPSVTYISELEYNPIITGKNYNRNFIVAFEDLGGDMDYNDLIVMVNEKLHFDAGSNKSHSITFMVTPIARGATSFSKLGFILYVNDRIILTDYVSTDVKRDLFLNQGDFINTFNHLPHISNLPLWTKRIPLNDSNLQGINLTQPIKIKITYFLEILGGRNYIAMTNKPLNQSVSYNSQINGNGYPYGLFIPSQTFRYPQEGSNIKSIYLDFDFWKNGIIPSPFTSRIDTTLLYRPK